MKVQGSQYVDRVVRHLHDIVVLCRKLKDPRQSLFEQAVLDKEASGEPITEFDERLAAEDTTGKLDLELEINGHCLGIAHELRDESSDELATDPKKLQYVLAAIKHAPTKNLVRLCAKEPIAYSRYEASRLELNRSRSGTRDIIDLLKTIKDPRADEFEKAYDALTELHEQIQTLGKSIADEIFTEDQL